LRVWKHKGEIIRLGSICYKQFHVFGTRLRVCVRISGMPERYNIFMISLKLVFISHLANLTSAREELCSFCA